MTKISIITPNFRQLDKLKLCAASVADQKGDFELEHLIEDGGSGSDFDEWAANQSSARCNSEADNGMYEAINRGFRKASGDIVAWLNSDEQYLPGALEKVRRFFEANPDVDIAFGDIVLVEETGEPLAYRKVIRPTLEHVRMCHLNTFSAATFVRSRVLRAGIYLDENWKIIADAVWVERMMAAGFQTGIISEPLAAFAMLGSNLGQSPQLFSERQKWENDLAGQGGSSVFQEKTKHRLKKLLLGSYLTRRVEIALYLRDGEPRQKFKSYLGGRWAKAREEAGRLRNRRDGGFACHKTRFEFSNGALTAIVAIMVILVVALDREVSEVVVVAPLCMATFLMFLSFRCRPRQMVAVAIVFAIVVAWSLTHMQGFTREKLIVRLMTFGISSTMAVLLASSRANTEDWLRSTISFIRNMPDPFILLDSEGRIIMVNTSCQRLLRADEREFLGKPFDPYLPVSAAAFESWGERPPQEEFQLHLSPRQDVLNLGRVFLVGLGREQIFGISVRSRPVDSYADIDRAAELKAGSRKQEAGSRKQEAGSRKQEAGSVVKVGKVSEKAPFHVAILNAYDHRNLGDRAIIETQIAWLERKHPGARYTVFSAAWKENESIFGSNRSLPPPFKRHGRFGFLTPISEGLLVWLGKRDDRSWLAFKAADAYFLCGGGYLYSSTSKLASRQLWIHIANSYLALSQGKPVMQFPQSWGPFHKSFDSWIAKKLAHRLPAISCRGAESYALMEAWGFGKKSWNIPDIVLAFGKLRPDLVKHQPEGDGRLGIAPADYRFARSKTMTDLERYIGKIADVAVLYQKRTGCGVTLFTQVNLEGTDDDEWVVRKLHGILLSRGIDSRVFGSLSWSSYLEEISKPSVFLGCRMHACIFAQISDVPTVGLAYQPKFHALFNELGLPERSVDIDSFEPDAISDLLCSIRDKKYREDVSDRVNQAAAITLDSVDAMWDTCGGRSCIAKLESFV